MYRVLLQIIFSLGALVPLDTVFAKSCAQSFSEVANQYRSKQAHKLAMLLLGEGRYGEFMNSTPEEFYFPSERILSLPLRGKNSLFDVLSELSWLTAGQDRWAIAEIGLDQGLRRVFVRAADPLKPLERFSFVRVIAITPELSSKETNFQVNLRPNQIVNEFTVVGSTFGQQVKWHYHPSGGEYGKGYLRAKSPKNRKSYEISYDQNYELTESLPTFRLKNKESKKKASGRVLPKGALNPEFLKESFEELSQFNSTAAVRLDEFREARNPLRMFEMTCKKQEITVTEVLSLMAELIARDRKSDHFWSKSERSASFHFNRLKNELEGRGEADIQVSMRLFKSYSKLNEKLIVKLNRFEVWHGKFYKVFVKSTIQAYKDGLVHPKRLFDSRLQEE